MNENAPTLPTNPSQMNQPTGQPQPLQFDFSEGDSKQVMTSKSGPKFQPGVYEWVPTHIEYRKSENPEHAGTMLAIYEGVIIRNLSPSGEGEQPGTKRAIVQLKSNEFGFYPTMRKFLAALQGLTDPNQTRTDGFNDVLNNPATYYGVALRLRVSERVSKKGHAYNVYDFDGQAIQSETDAFLSTNPELAALATPQGTRAQQNLAPASEYFTVR